MSLKDLFGKKSLDVSPDLSPTELASEVESIDFLSEQIKEKNRFVPDVNYKDPSKFSRFGSAEKYYEDTIQSIYDTYPYDGSFKERLQWHNNSSDLQNYIFDNVYPRKNGYINLGQNYGSLISTVDGYSQYSVQEYIKFNGSLNTTPESKSTKDLFKKSNKLNISKKRGYNLNIDGDEGVTVEFYFKRDNLQGSAKQVILDVWNSEQEGTEKYGRFKIETHPGISGEQDKFYIEISSGSSGIQELEIGSNLDFIGNWHHYGIAFINHSSSLKVQLFIDGDLAQEILTGSEVSQVYGAMNGRIGALITSASGSSGTAAGWGKLSGSLDEFRYWKTKRTDKEIARNYFTTVGGGTNSDDSNIDLGVYFKFNEGIFSTASLSVYDSNIVDYSGRISNGVWIGNVLSSRNTGSALIESGFTNKEFEDPILYSNHPQVTSILKTYKEIGNTYDRDNSSYVFNTIPEWMADEDVENGNGLKDLMQIMAEFFDDLQLKIEYLPALKNLEYSSGKPLPFSERLLQNYNFEVADLFSNSSLLELFYNRNETEDFEEKIYNIKNFIYQNIYNNIMYIYRSKGTEKSFRNFLRCFGIDDELIRLNMYSSNVEFYFDDRFRNKTVKKRFVDFNDPDRFDSIVYQAEEPGNPNSIGFLTGSLDLSYFGWTMETEVVFPKKFPYDSPLYFQTPFVSCSLFGVHESEDGIWKSPDRAELQVYAVKDFEESSDVRFVVSSSYLQVEATSELFRNVYENSRWNFALSVRPETYPNKGAVYGSTDGTYIVELYGVNTIQDIVQNSFVITASAQNINGNGFFEANKIVYIGANRIDFNGPVVVGPGENNEQFTDVKISSVRVWNSYLGKEATLLHAKDAQNFGSYHTYRGVDSFLAPNLNTNYIYEPYGKVPQIETLALHWDFSQVTGSDNGTGISNLDDGTFIVADISSGSIDSLSNNLIAKYTKHQFTGKGDQFPRNSSEVVQDEFLFSTKRRLPEVMNNDDMINILTNDDEYYSRDSTPVNHYFAIEKSMYQTISEDILNWFGTIKDFNNLVGNPKYKYEDKYLDLEKLREIYFRNIQNEPDFEKFTTYYKWIDDSISRMIEQLIPASMNYSPGVGNIVESHILERNKYRHKLPTIEFKGEPPLGPAKSINELLYNWETGHAPIPLEQNKNCQWWLLRSERFPFTFRQGIFDAKTSALNRKFSTVYNFDVHITTNSFDKKRETEIIRNKVGFDLTGTDFLEVTDLFNIDKDCDD